MESAHDERQQTLAATEARLRRFHVSAAAARQGARPDRRAGDGRRRHRPVRGPLAPVAVAGVRRTRRNRRKTLRDEAGRPRPASRPTCSSRSTPTSSRSRSTSPTPRAAAARATGSCARSTTPSRLGSPHVTTLPGVYFEADEPQDDSWQRSQDELAWRVEQAQAARHRLRRRSPRRLARARARRRPSGWSQACPGLTLTLDYTHFTRLGLPDSRDRAAREARLALPRPRRPRRAGSRQLQGQHDRLRPRAAKRCAHAATRGYLGIEYVWIDWEHCNECDNLSETILFRDFLRGMPDAMIVLSLASQQCCRN